MPINSISFKRLRSYGGHTIAAFLLCMIPLVVSCGQNAVVNDAETKAQLQLLERRAGLIFTPGTRLIYHSDGGGREASHQFYCWTVLSPVKVDLPKMKESYVEKGYLEMPLESSVRLLKVGAKHEDFSSASVAISSNWETNGYEFRATLVRAKQGDYVHLQQFKVK